MRNKQKIINANNFRKFVIFWERLDEDLVDNESDDELRNFNQDETKCYVFGIKRFTVNEKLSLNNRHALYGADENRNIKILTWRDLNDYKMYVDYRSNKNPFFVHFSIDKGVYHYEPRFNFLDDIVIERIANPLYAVMCSESFLNDSSKPEINDSFFHDKGIRWLEYYDEETRQLISAEKYNENIEEKQQEKEEKEKENDGRIDNFEDLKRQHKTM